MTYIQQFDEIIACAKTHILKEVEAEGGSFILLHNPTTKPDTPGTPSDPQAIVDLLTPMSVLNLADAMSRSIGSEQTPWGDQVVTLCVKAVFAMKEQIAQYGHVVLKQLQPDGIFKNETGEPVKVPTIASPIFKPLRAHVTELKIDMGDLMVVAETLLDGPERLVKITMPVEQLDILEILVLGDFVGIL